MRTAVIICIAVVLCIAGLCGAFLLLRQWNQAVLHPTPTLVHREKMQADLDALQVHGLQVESVRYVDTDMPGACGEVQLPGASSLGDGLDRIGKGRKTTGVEGALVAFSVDRSDYLFFERTGRLHACVAGYGYGERLRFEYLAAD
ncbi:MAG: hypothetical protein ACO1SV_16605 [Fimbriimonas sp.]